MIDVSGYSSAAERQRLWNVYLQVRRVRFSCRQNHLWPSEFVALLVILINCFELQFGTRFLTMLLSGTYALLPTANGVRDLHEEVNVNTVRQWECRVMIVVVFCRLALYIAAVHSSVTSYPPTGLAIYDFCFRCLSLDCIEASSYQSTDRSVKKEFYKSTDELN